MNEIARGYWDLAEQWIAHADNVDDINNTIAYTGMAECALKLARFAVENPALVMGVDEFAPPGPGNSPAPRGPTEGPKFWGAPQS
jgi:hypothetical protein